MARDSESFSRRLGFRPENPPITIWEDAPDDFRTALLHVARDDCKLSQHDLREIVCNMLRKKPDSGNWSEGPVWNEVTRLVENCDWFRVYDLIEAIWNSFARNAGVPDW